MSYATSSQDFWLENGHILHAKCKDSNGDLQDSSLDLNQFIGNSDGWFIWDGESACHLHPAVIQRQPADSIEPC
jgi:hypothetical protein